MVNKEHVILIFLRAATWLMKIKINKPYSSQSHLKGPKSFAAMVLN